MPWSSGYGRRLIRFQKNELKINTIVVNGISIKEPKTKTKYYNDRVTRLSEQSSSEGQKKNNYKTFLADVVVVGCYRERERERERESSY